MGFAYRYNLCYGMGFVYYNNKLIGMIFAISNVIWHDSCARPEPEDLFRAGNARIMPYNIWNFKRKSCQLIFCYNLQNLCHNKGYNDLMQNP